MSPEHNTPSSLKTTTPGTVGEEPSKPPSPVLCPHCKRTADNGIRCQGVCVADNDY
ncbi:MAG: hypothetical protein ACON4T_08800 [Synechococcus sp.]